MKHAIPAVIFAGGRSSRMGKDKALLPFGRYNTLAEYQFNRLQNIFDRVYLSAKESKFDFVAPLILDRYPTASPLVGIVSFFESMACDAVFILSVDTPFVKNSMIDTLIQTWEGEDAVIARSNGRAQPLCGLYARTILPMAKKEMEKGNHKLGMLLKKTHTKYVDFAEKEAFFNLNYPHEYEAAIKIISS